MPEDWDGVYKRLFRDFPVQALQLLCDIDIDADGMDGPVEEAVVALPTEFTMKLRADGVFAVRRRGGEALLVHVEVQRQPVEDLELRLVRYWLAVTTEHGSAPHQVVILPRGGPYTGRYDAGRLTLRYDVVDVTELDRDVLLASVLAPLVLTRPDSAPPSPGLVDAVVARVAAATPDPDARATLVDLAMLGADVGLATMISDSLRRHGMGNVLERTTEGQELLARGRVVGEAAGRVAGEAEGRVAGEAAGRVAGEAAGRVAGEAAGLRVLLAEKFGESDELAAIALALAGQGFAAGLRRIRAAGTLGELRG